MKNIIKKIKPLYFILNKIRHFKIEIIFTNIHYFICLVLKKPYFGKKYGANIQSKKEREILRRLVKQVQNLKENIKCLEIGSWAGCSAVTIAETIKKSAIGGMLYCIDVWRGTDENIKITKGKVSASAIFNLFKHNVKYSGVENYIIPIQMTSDEFAEKEKDTQFDFIYIDGDHKYTQAKKDFINYFNILEIGGIMCGDDLDYFSDQIDENLAKENREKDFVTDKEGRTYHAGVTLAVKDVWNNKVGMRHSIWSIQKTKDGWIPYNYSS